MAPARPSQQPRGGSWQHRTIDPIVIPCGRPVHRRRSPVGEAQEPASEDPALFGQRAVGELGGGYSTESEEDGWDVLRRSRPGGRPGSSARQHDERQSSEHCGGGGPDTDGDQHSQPYDAQECGELVRDDGGLCHGEQAPTDTRHHRTERAHRHLHLDHADARGPGARVTPSHRASSPDPDEIDLRKIQDEEGHDRESDQAHVGSRRDRMLAKLGRFSA